MQGSSNDTGLETRAACLVNPASGIANDYLNIFNEILLLIENLPVLLPELLADLEKWEPVSYREYFEKSPLPGSQIALAAYDQIDPALREAFEEKVAKVAEIARAGKAFLCSPEGISAGGEPEALEARCGELATELRSALMDVTDLVNSGDRARSARAQAIADRLMQLSA